MTTMRAAAGTTAQAARPGWRAGLALLVIAAAQLMVVLDATIVNVALPHIQRALGLSGSGLEWVVNAYMLVFGAVTGTAGVTALVYGLSNGATTADGVAHWGGVRVLVSLTAAAVLLVAFAVLGPLLITGAALGIVFVPLSLIALSGAGEQDSGAASSLLNVGEQVGGAVGLAVLGTVAWTVVANTIRAGYRANPGHAQSTALYHHAPAAGFSRGFLVAATIMLLAVAIAAATGRQRPSAPECSHAVPGPDDATAIPAS